MGEPQKDQQQGYGFQFSLQNFNQNFENNDFILACTTRKKSTKEKLRNQFKKIFTKKTLYKKLPILTWLPKYNKSHAVSDLIAGITVGMTIIPQGLAYSSIAGVPPHYGLYSAFLGSFIYIIFGTCKDAAVGPTAIVSMLVFKTVNKKGLEYTILLCFLTGIVQLLMGLLGLGFLIDFISSPVTSGFLSSASIIIVTSQVKNLLGIEASDSSFIDTWIDIGHNIKDTKLWDVILGLLCLIVLLLLKSLGEVKIGFKENKYQKFLNNSIWLVSSSRNAILVIVCSVISYCVCSDGNIPFTIIGDVPAGFPPVQPPLFSYQQYRNNTLVKSENFLDMVADLGFGIIVVALIGLLEDIGVCKAFSYGKTIDANQEFIAIGLCNIGNSFVQGFAGSGALARSAVNHSCGVKTTLGGLYTGILVIISIIFLTPYFYYIPKSTLAAIIIVAVVFMVEIKVIKPMWKVKKCDLLTAIITFVACLILPLQYGILIGIATNMVFIIYQAARPKITVEKFKSEEGRTFLLLKPDRCLIFPSVNYVRDLVLKQSFQEKNPVVIDCSHIYGADYTAATAIKSLIQDFSDREQPIFFYNLKTSVSYMIDELEPKDFFVFYNRDEVDKVLKKWCTKRGRKRY